MFQKRSELTHHPQIQNTATPYSPSTTQSLDLSAGLFLQAVSWEGGGGARTISSGLTPPTAEVLFNSLKRAFLSRAGDLAQW